MHRKHEQFTQKTINLKHQLQHGMKNWVNWNEEKTDNPLIRMHINKIENKITFKIKTAYYLELFTPETMKLFGNTRSKITKGEKRENKHHPESTKVVLVHCNIANNSY